MPTNLIRSIPLQGVMRTPSPSRPLAIESPAFRAFPQPLRPDQCGIAGPDRFRNSESHSVQRVGGDSARRVRRGVSVSVGSSGSSKTRGQVVRYEKLATPTYGSPAKAKTFTRIALGWPADGKILVKSLSEGSANYPRQIRKVELLGSKYEVKWTRGTNGLEIQVPDVPPCKYAFSFRILPT